MKSYIENGVLVLADISGFTAFVTATELEHGPPIIAELLGEVMRQLSPPLEIQEVEGDAVFALGSDRALAPPAILLEVLKEAFTAFRTRQRELAADESCSCRACRSVGNLDLKIVAHHGRFLRQMVGDRSQAAGVNVVLVHRLLKNDWPGQPRVHPAHRRGPALGGRQSSGGDAQPPHRALRALRRRPLLREGPGARRADGVPARSARRGDSGGELIPGS